MLLFLLLSLYLQAAERPLPQDFSDLPEEIRFLMFTQKAQLDIAQSVQNEGDSGNQSLQRDQAIRKMCAQKALEETAKALEALLSKR